MAEREGSYSCGQLRVQVAGDPLRVGMCHCLTCQQRSGSVFAIQARFAADAVRTEGRASEYVRISDEGEPRSFYFCSQCGSRSGSRARQPPTPSWSRSECSPTPGSQRRVSLAGRNASTPGSALARSACATSTRTPGSAARTKHEAAERRRDLWRIRCSPLLCANQLSRTAGTRRSQSVSSSRTEHRTCRSVWWT
jgi:hypothetical protein